MIPEKPWALLGRLIVRGSYAAIPLGYCLQYLAPWNQTHLAVYANRHERAVDFARAILEEEQC